MKVTFIGSGNVATHMALALKTAGAHIDQIWSRNIEHAAALATLVGARPVSALSEVDTNAGLLVIAVKDDAIAEVCKALKGVRALVVHTSGATDLHVLSSFENYGVLYPLQTFSKSRPIDFVKVPLFIEAGNGEALNKLKSIASKLSPLIYEATSDQRKILHLSAVFACNFVNHLYALGNQLLEDNGLDFEMLRPLILETAEKVRHDLPLNVQTGPAVRDDQQTILKHMELLEGKPHLQEIYQALSKSIKKTR
ncbi:MAG TPA: DUF2520 domain-containing protein [Pedobacter sp.]|uniref:Rossmann-like and DUF2520 domain-containing protein n=1 Tax=Pedobacter sp. TaxID=1411316 RepID=UPI002BC26DC4|nr:DUF2520 domain-containing protein [Pedobacter sp.]HMI00910.1 DUF2520 domain-containing protein [Pedobacter sp.]